MVTGIVLAMFYSANTEVAFGVVLSITNEIYYG
jgi:quinol-cytochrome oxidoreductase complex cytochrome b subunit